MRLLSLFSLAVSLPALAQVGNLQLSTSALSFSATVGNTVPQSQIVGASSTGAPRPVNVSVRYFTPTEGWLSATADHPITPANITVTVNSSGLPAGVYNGQVLVVASGSQSGLVTVTLTVASTVPGGNVITASPATVALASSDGHVAQSAVALSSAGAIPFQVFVSTANGGNWLSYIAASTTSPTSITISANPAGLTTGVYTGTVNIAPSAGITGVAIPVTFTVGTGSVSGFSLSPTSLSFIYQTGTANPASQSTYVSNFDGIVNYAATSNVTWARLTSNNNSTPSPSVNGTSNSNLTVHVDPTGLAPGFYAANISVNASNARGQTLAVTLTVSGTSLLSASPSSFVFNYNPDAGIPTSQQTTITATGGPIAFNASASSTGWLLVGPQTGNTGGLNVLTVSVNPVGLAAGTYHGAINVTSGVTSLTIPVTLTVGTTSFNSISSSPTSLNFQSQVGSPASSQLLYLTSATTKNFLATALTSSGNWLQVTPSSGVTPSSLTVTITPLAVGQAGTYNGIIQVSNLSDATQLAIPVSMTLNGASLTVSPQTLSFSLSAGSTAATTQTVQLSGTANNTFTASSDAAWLTATPIAGTIPGNINISASASGLTPGNYTGTITFTSSGATTTVTANLNVTNSAAPILTPSTLTFQFTPGSAVPPAQTITVNSTAAPIQFSVTSTTSLGGNWLSVTSNTNTTPALLTVNVLPAGLAAGTYNGLITVSTSGGSDVRNAQVTLLVTAPAGPSIRTALHGATRELSAVAPGMLLSIQGRALGPVVGINGIINSAGAVETTLNGFRVLFDGVPAPILYSTENRIDVVAPYAIAGRQGTRVQVENSGIRSEILDLSISPDAAPGIFSLDNSGRGQASAINENGTVNSTSNPVSQTGILVFYATGEGQTRPAGQDGRIIVSDIRVPVLPVAVNIGGVPVEVLYAGSAPGQVSGVMQVNVRLNTDVPRGPNVPLELRVGPAPSPSGLTIAVQ